MNKKLVIGGVVLLLVIGGGLFLLFGQTKTKFDLGESGSDTIPTQWSQAGDYKIEETAGGTVVTNSKAGFSFKVPQNWKIKGEEGISADEYFLSILSPDAQINEVNKRLLQGCGIGLNTFFQEDQWFFWNNLVIGYQDKPDRVPPKDKVIRVGSQSAIKTTLIAETDEIREKIGDNIQIHVPVANNEVIEFGMTIMPKHEGDCLAKFDTFLSGFLID